MTIFRCLILLGTVVQQNGAKTDVQLTDERCILGFRRIFLTNLRTNFIKPKFLEHGESRKQKPSKSAQLENRKFSYACIQKCISTPRCSGVIIRAVAEMDVTPNLEFGGKDCSLITIFLKPRLRLLKSLGRRKWAQNGNQLMAMTAYVKDNEKLCEQVPEEKDKSTETAKSKTETGHETTNSKRPKSLPFSFFQKAKMPFQEHRKSQKAKNLRRHRFFSSSPKKIAAKRRFKRESLPSTKVLNDDSIFKRIRSKFRPNPSQASNMSKSIKKRDIDNKQYKAILKGQLAIADIQKEAMKAITVQHRILMDRHNRFNRIQNANDMVSAIKHRKFETLKKGFPLPLKTSASRFKALNEQSYHEATKGSLKPDAPRNQKLETLKKDFSNSAARFKASNEEDQHESLNSLQLDASSQQKSGLLNSAAQFKASNWQDQHESAENSLKSDTFSQQNIVKSKKRLLNSADQFKAANQRGQPKSAENILKPGASSHQKLRTLKQNIRTLPNSVARFNGQHDSAENSLKPDASRQQKNSFPNAGAQFQASNQRGQPESEESNLKSHTLGQQNIGISKKVMPNSVARFKASNGRDKHDSAENSLKPDASRQQKNSFPNSGAQFKASNQRGQPESEESNLKSHTLGQQTIGISKKVMPNSVARFKALNGRDKHDSAENSLKPDASRQQKNSFPNSGAQFKASNQRGQPESEESNLKSHTLGQQNIGISKKVMPNSVARFKASNGRDKHDSAENSLKPDASRQQKNSFPNSGAQFEASNQRGQPKSEESNLKPHTLGQQNIGISKKVMPDSVARFKASNGRDKHDSAENSLKPDASRQQKNSFPHSGAQFKASNQRGQPELAENDLKPDAVFQKHTGNLNKGFPNSAARFKASNEEDQHESLNSLQLDASSQQKSGLLNSAAQFKASNGQDRHESAKTNLKSDEQRQQKVRTSKKVFPTSAARFKVSKGQDQPESAKKSSKPNALGQKEQVRNREELKNQAVPSSDMNEEPAEDYDITGSDEEYEQHSTTPHETGGLGKLDGKGTAETMRSTTGLSNRDNQRHSEAKEIKPNLNIRSKYSKIYNTKSTSKQSFDKEQLSNVKKNLDSENGSERTGKSTFKSADAESSNTDGLQAGTFSSLEVLNGNDKENYQRKLQKEKKRIPDETDLGQYKKEGKSEDNKTGHEEKSQFKSADAETMNEEFSTETPKKQILHVAGAEFSEENQKITLAEDAIKSNSQISPVIQKKKKKTGSKVHDGIPDETELDKDENDRKSEDNKTGQNEKSQFKSAEAEIVTSEYSEKRNSHVSGNRNKQKVGPTKLKPEKTDHRDDLKHQTKDEDKNSNFKKPSYKEKKSQPKKNLDNEHGLEQTRKSNFKSSNVEISNKDESQAKIIDRHKVLNRNDGGIDLVKQQKGANSVHEEKTIEPHEKDPDSDISSDQRSQSKSADVEITNNGSGEERPKKKGLYVSGAPNEQKNGPLKNHISKVAKMLDSKNGLPRTGKAHFKSANDGSSNTDKLQAKTMNRYNDVNPIDEEDDEVKQQEGTKDIHGQIHLGPNKTYPKSGEGEITNTESAGEILKTENLHDSNSPYKQKNGPTQEEMPKVVKKLGGKKESGRTGKFHFNSADAKSSNADDEHMEMIMNEMLNTLKQAELDPDGRGFGKLLKKMKKLQQSLVNNENYAKLKMKEDPAKVDDPIQLKPMIFQDGQVGNEDAMNVVDPIQKKHFRLRAGGKKFNEDPIEVVNSVQSKSTTLKGKQEVNEDPVKIQEEHLAKSKTEQDSPTGVMKAGMIHKKADETILHKLKKVQKNHEKIGSNLNRAQQLISDAELKIRKNSKAEATILSSSNNNILTTLPTNAGSKSTSADSHIEEIIEEMIGLLSQGQNNLKKAGGEDKEEDLKRMEKLQELQEKLKKYVKDRKAASGATKSMRAAKKGYVIEPISKDGNKDSKSEVGVVQQPEKESTKSPTNPDSDKTSRTVLKDTGHGFQRHKIKADEYTVTPKKATASVDELIKLEEQLLSDGPPEEVALAKRMVRAGSGLKNVHQVKSAENQGTLISGPRQTASVVTIGFLSFILARF